MALVYWIERDSAYMISELLGGVAGLLPFTSNGQKTDALLWMHTQIFNLIPNPGWAAFGYSFAFMAICFIPGMVPLLEEDFFESVSGDIPYCSESAVAPRRMNTR